MYKFCKNREQDTRTPPRVEGKASIPNSISGVSLRVSENELNRKRMAW